MKWNSPCGLLEKRRGKSLSRALVENVPGVFKQLDSVAGVRDGRKRSCGIIIIINKYYIYNIYNILIILYYFILINIILILILYYINLLILYNIYNIYPWFLAQSS